MTRNKWVRPNYLNGSANTSFFPLLWALVLLFFSMFALTKGAAARDQVTLSEACIVGFQVELNGAASPGASVTSIAWNWGDGTSTIGFFPEGHTYKSAGSYDVQVTAHYENGSSASAPEHVKVGSGVVQNCPVVKLSNDSLNRRESRPRPRTQT